MRKSMTYGVMPSRGEFDAACAEADPENGRSVDNHGFHFGNDPRLGTVSLNGEELWDELVKARAEYEALLQADVAEGDEAEGAVGDWISGVLGCLGFEWV